jgi:hypothetical protein
MVEVIEPASTLAGTDKENAEESLEADVERLEPDDDAEESLEADVERLESDDEGLSNTREEEEVKDVVVALVLAGTEDVLKLPCGAVKFELGRDPLEGGWEKVPFTGGAGKKDPFMGGGPLKFTLGPTEKFPGGGGKKDPLLGGPLKFPGGGGRS